MDGRLVQKIDRMRPGRYYEKAALDAGTRCDVAYLKLPPRSTAGQLTLDQHIGVRIPGGQPNVLNHFRPRRDANPYDAVGEGSPACEPQNVRRPGFRIDDLRLDHRLEIALVFAGRLLCEAICYGA
jgi:hypothetical protein